MIKYCLDCIYCKRDTWIGRTCTCPKLQHDLDGYVDGRRWRLANLARIDCGSEGRFFEPRPKTWIQKLFRKEISNNES